MEYVAESNKTVEDAARDLQEAVKRHGFGVLHVYDLQETLAAKGVELGSACRIFDVCNPQQAAAVLSKDMTLSMALPCRVSVYSDDGRTRIGMIKPTELLGGLSDKTDLAGIAREVEAAIKKMIDEAA